MAVDSKSDIEDLFKPIENDPDAPAPYIEPPDRFKEEITDAIRGFACELLEEQSFKSRKDYNKRYMKIRKKYKINPRKSTLLKVANQLSLPKTQFLIKKLHKSTSGIVEISVMTKMDKFSCKFDCYMCPSFPDYPRSYIPGEPTSQSAKRFKFEAALMILDRCRTLRDNGHNVDKLEIIILGGTWSSYDDEYQELFVRDCYYAANVFEDWYYQRPVRRRLTLEEEIDINQNKSQTHIIGFTPETRPDCINPREILRFRKFGFTRVQIGIQHTDDAILKKINRMCKIKHNIRGIKLLKEAGFKVDAHFMLDLPGSSPKKDLDMLMRVINDPDFQVDHWKIYPTSITHYTEIEKWYKEGLYKPYSEHNGGQELVELILKIIPHIPEYVRVNRIFRDIPSTEIIGGANLPHLRQVLTNQCQIRGIMEHDIRAREVRDRPFIDPHIFIQKYEGTDGTEYFISIENTDKTVLYGFIRLRINNPEISAHHYIPILRNSAIIRELHVYGSLIKVTQITTTTASQHKGIGKLLVALAEQIAVNEGYTKMAIIAGVGVRNYYKNKLNYTLEDTYMIKDLIKYPPVIPTASDIPHGNIASTVPRETDANDNKIPSFEDIDFQALLNIWVFILFAVTVYNYIYNY